MLIEIAICTWNRAPRLQETLSSVGQLKVPAGVAWKVIVVDNNSSDATQEVLYTFRDRLPLQIEFEVEPGHTRARNRAIAVSRGDLVLWTDDDVYLNEEWLESYCRAARGQPEVSFWGGRIEPIFIDPIPAWIRQRWDLLKGAFAERDLGLEPLEFNETRLPYGANFAVRGDVQRKFLFNTSLGRVTHQVLGEDEFDVMRRLLAAGHRGRWVPDNGVRHVIPPQRTSTRYLYQYFVGQGRALVHQGRAWTESRPALRWRAVKHARDYFLKRRVFGSVDWVDHLVGWALARGQLEALQAKPPRSRPRAG